MVRPIVEIAVNVPLRRTFHYEVPEPLAQRLEVGHRVLIPFGRRQATGVCVGFPRESEVPKLKPVREVLHPDCRFDAHLLEFTRWIADYYRASWGEVLESALPPSIRSGRRARRLPWVKPGRPRAELLAEADRQEAKRALARARLLRELADHGDAVRQSELLERARTDSGVVKWLAAHGWVEVELRKVDTAPPEVDLDGLSSRAGAQLHPQQAETLAAITAAIDSGEFSPALLHGVTGSGKTEVYIRALRHALDRGRRGLVLVPEIALTPQTVHRFQQGLRDEEVAVLHSMLGDQERTRYWRRIQSGEARLVIGARSAVFAPVPELGLIVVDEEHEPSYKQESSPRYNARDAAVVRAHMLGIPIVLGSATPSLESLQNARSGRYHWLKMPERVTSQPLPVITSVALDGDFYRLDGSGLITEALDRLIRRSLRRSEQVLLFLNRRGFATWVHCLRCKWVARCEHCDITLTWHRGENRLRCHYCGLVRPIPKECPDCSLPAPRRSGVGTEKLTAELERRYDAARIARLDRDTVSSHADMQETLGRFARGEFDILVGTQMVAKGHDFPGVTLVGIINADTGLHFPDFRAAERTYSLITQVSGRAGRGDRAGRVVVQSFQPDHYAIHAAVKGDEQEFQRRELEERADLGYPPFGHLAKLLFQGEDGARVEREAAEVASRLKSAATAGCMVLGPVEAPIAKIQGRHRFQVLVKSPAREPLHRVLAALEGPASGGRRSKKVDVVVDVDPYSML